ncbi:DUF4409 domain protein [Medicago truncatula]|uniref:DUF4409 domain protein n=1 Tax=Medicago truncatula TaxID=3880 RepID=A0A072TTJ9_MEDTR|nr:DUF4409 domain protein [Medicago truncatula]
MNAIELASSMGFFNIWLESDSQFGFQVNIWENCLKLTHRMRFCTTHIYWEGNTCADNLANFGLTLSSLDLFWFDTVPDFVRGGGKKFGQTFNLFVRGNHGGIVLKWPMSPDGDIIDCILTHKQLAFDHPLLKGQKPLDPPKISRRLHQRDDSSTFQLWSLSGESCPDGTIPVRRITEQDVLRVGSITQFGRKYTDGYKVCNHTNSFFFY